MWWILATIVGLLAIPWIISVLSRLPLDGVDESDAEPLAMLHDRALLLYRGGDFDAAESLLKEAIARAPAITEGTDADADLRFHLVLMLASSAREWHADPKKELELLQECAEIVATRRVGVSPADQPDRFNAVYMMQMNRSIAAGKLGFHELEEEALTLAFRVAHERETKCKCLAAQAWSILRQQNRSKDARVIEIIGDFDSLAENTDVPAGLSSRVRTAEAMVHLYRGDVMAARDASAAAARDNPLDRLAEIMLDRLVAPEVDPLNVIVEVWQLIAKRQPPPSGKPLPALPKGIVEPEVWERMQQLSGRDAMSEQEFERFEAHAEALAKSGQHAKQESLARQMLQRHTQPDEIHVNLLQILARALMREDKYDEALARAGESIALAYRCNDPLLVVMMLDLRAEILCFAEEHVAALRTLEAAERVLRDAEIRNEVVETWIAHTRGMAFAGCGWWDASAANLKKAIQGGEQLRNWTEWAGAAGDFVALTLRRTQSEGPDVEELEEALGLLKRIIDWHRRYNEGYLSLQAELDTLRIRSILSIRRRDLVELWSVREDLDRIMEVAGGRNGFLNQPGNAGKLTRWTVDHCRHLRALIEIRGSDRADIRNALDEQLSLLERATNRAPRHASLWSEKAALHLFRARQRLDDPAGALLAAADCVEMVMDVRQSFAKRYLDPEVRAGWIGASNELFELLAEVAMFALDEVDPPDLDVAARMIELAQFQRARSRQDIARSVGGERSPHDVEIADLLARIRLLRRWRDRIGRPSSPLTAEITASYPEYARLQTTAHVDDELKKKKRELNGRVTGRSLLHLDSASIEEESPFDLSEFQSRLRDGEVVLDYYLGPRSLHAAVISRSTVDLWRIPIGDMRAFRNNIRQNLYPSQKLAESMRQCGEWLFPEYLVSMIDDCGGTRLYIVASGPLWSVPFPWLHAAGRLVLERWETCVVPSARFAGTNWTTPSFRAACAIGHPGHPPLGNAEFEIRSVATLLDCSTLFDTEATPQTIVSKVLPEAEVLHFACHAWCDPVSPLMSYLHLQPDDEHPDGLLTLYEILESPLRASLVSLGACSTARVDGPTSFPESLAHAFLGNNAQFVVAALWPAKDDDCRDLAERFYTALKGGADPPSAFRHAQLEQLATVDVHSLTYKEYARFGTFILLSASRQERSAS